MRLLKTVRKILVPTAAICAIFLIGGMAYSLLSGGDVKTPAPVKKAQTEDVGTSDIKPTKPGPNAPASVALYMLQESVSAGSNAGASVKTVPTASCSIGVTYNGAAGSDSGLTPKTADDFGVVGWTWTVPAGVPAGKWPVKVTCVYNGRSAVGIADLLVTH